MTWLFEFPHTLARKALDYWRRLWVRVALMGAFAVLAMALTQPVEWLLPQDLQTRLAGPAADRLLDIIANAMLAVTIFSLTVMVSVFNNVSSQWTPRIHRLAMQDEVTLHTLATFIGAWVYALMGIVLRELGVFPDDAATVLFAMTVLVLAYVAWSLIRWVLHLQTFGSLLASTREVEEITCRNLAARFDHPCLGGNAFVDDAPEGATEVTAPKAGYVQNVYQEALNAVCNDHDLTVWLHVSPGDLLSQGDVILQVSGDDPDAVADNLSDFITLGDVRLHDQDPRFGLVVLSEIASKALSPGINDPGTAIDVVTRGGRILTLYADEEAHVAEHIKTQGTPEHDRLYVRPLDPGDLIDDLFGPIVRYGAGDLSVQIHVQKVLAGLERHEDAGLRRAAQSARADFARRVIQTLDFEPDRDRFAQHAPQRARDAG